MKSTTNKVAYRWLAIADNYTDHVPLEDIRLVTLKVTDRGRSLVSAVPVLMGDGRHPSIRVKSGDVWSSTDPAKRHKLYWYVPESAEDQKNLKALPMMYKGDPDKDSVFKAIADDMMDLFDEPAHCMEEPMWCRWSKSPDSLTPIDNLVNRDIMGIRAKDEIDPRHFIIRWREIDPHITAMLVTPTGMLWEASGIKRGGVVCAPKTAYDEHGKMKFATKEGVMIDSDFNYMCRTRKWRL